MTKNWKKYKLEEVVDYINRGVSPSYTNEGVPVINQKCIRGGQVLKNDIKYHDLDKRKVATEKFLQSHDVLICSTGTGTLGRVGQLKEVINELICDSHVTIVRPGKLTNPLFLGWYLRLLQPYIENMAEGSTGQTELAREKVKNIEILLPPLPEQQAIAEILSALDDKIELNLQMNKTLEEMANALYKHWFVDFGPFKNGKFVESELGMIPEGWNVKCLGELVEHQKGYAFKSQWFQNHGKAVVRISDTTENSINTTSCHKIAYDLATTYKDYALKTNDVIIASVGSWPPNYTSVVGKVIRVPIHAEGALLNQNAVKLNMKIEGKTSQGLLYYLLKDARFSRYIVSCAQGSANQASIKLTDIFNYNIPLGPANTFEKFSETIELYVNQQNLLVHENQTLQYARDYLLPKLISGEIRVKDIHLPTLLKEGHKKEMV